MQNCTYCGRENEETASFCLECGTSLTDPAAEIWDHFALKRRQFYLAGFLIGALGGLVVVALKHGSDFWLPLVGGVAGLGAVVLLTLLERWQAGLAADRARGLSTTWKSAFFVLGSLLALSAAALAFGGFVVLCTR